MSFFPSIQRRAWSALLAFSLFLAPIVFGAGSGLNVIIVANQSSSNSLALANHYAEKRGVPPQHILRISWTGSISTWSEAEAQSLLMTPLLNFIQTRGLANQIDVILLSMDIPYRVGTDTELNGTTSYVYYGFKENDPNPTGMPCMLASSSYNQYFASEYPFRLNPPDAEGRQPFLAMMMTGNNLAEAKRAIDRAVASDETFPAEEVILQKTSDANRNVRYVLFDNAVFSTRVLNAPRVIRLDSNSTAFQNIFGLQTGLDRFTLNRFTFVPGAMADSLTSYGGSILVPNDQTNVLHLIESGAAAAYGTIIEPCNFLEKFPNPMNYFYQGRGFSVAESYYQSLENPYQGNIVGEPLAAPFRRSALGNWVNSPEGKILNGTASVSFSFLQAENGKPVGRTDMFVNGVLQQTIASIAPSAGNRLNLNVNGTALSVTVTTGNTIGTLATNVASAINQNAALGVTATPIGDRVELKSTVFARSGSSMAVTAGTDKGTAPELTTFLWTPQATFLDSTARGLREFTLSGNPTIGSVLSLTVTKTNQQQVTLSVTNSTANQTLHQFVLQLAQKVNTAPELTSASGLSMDDIEAPVSSFVTLNLRARSGSWGAAKIAAQITALSSIVVTPSNASTLEGNISDLYPRAQLYVSAGTTERTFGYNMDTTRFPDGPHDFTAVAYEGTHVLTQTLLKRQFQIRNFDWNATIMLSQGGAIQAIESPIKLQVGASTTNIRSIDLYSTTGLLQRIQNQNSAEFEIQGSTLGEGLHYFYAIVENQTGQKVRTYMLPVRFTGRNYAVELTMISPGVLLYDAPAQRTYLIQSTDDLNQAFVTRATVRHDFAGPYVWNDPGPLPAMRYYRVVPQ